MFYLQLVIQCVISILNYTEALPFHEKIMPFDVWELPIQYALLMILPIHKFQEPVIYCAPFLLVTIFFKTDAQYDSIYGFKVHVPADQWVEFSKRSVIETRLWLMVLFIAFSCACHYMIQLQTVTLIIEKHRIQKQ